MKTCTSCHRTFPIEAFPSRRGKRRGKPESRCLPCHRKQRTAEAKKCREAHPHIRRAIIRRWYAKHKDRIRQSSNKYKEEWKERPGVWERIREVANTYRKHNLQKMRELSQKSYRKHREAIAAQRKIQRQAGKFRVYRLFRRARLRGAPGKFTQAGILGKLLYYGWLCRYCTTPLTKQNLSMDHAIPVTRGGSNWLANMIPCCRRCNSRKNTKTFTEFMHQE